MKNEYVIGAIVGIVVGVVVAKNMNSAPTTAPPLPSRPTNVPQQKATPVLSGFNYDRRRPLVGCGVNGFRPWGYTTYPIHV